MRADDTAATVDAEEAISPPVSDAGESIQWLVDNADAYRETLRAIGRAGRSIWITQLAIDADCRAYGIGVPDDDSSGSGMLLLDALRDAAARGVAVRIIVNETFLLDTAAPLRRAIARTGGGDLRVRGIKRFPQLIHTKMLIVDEREALLLGSPFVNGYWDYAGHPPDDPRRPARELGGRPLHDLSTRITGPAVRSLGAIFVELWNEASVGAPDDAPIEPRPAEPLDRPSSVAIVRSAPRRLLPRHPNGLTEIVGEIERGIASARRLIYIEHQYLSSRRVIDALAAVLAREPALEVIVVLNQNADVTAYRGWQNARLGDAGLTEHPRVGLFALWRAVPSARLPNEWAVNQLFIHSKVLIVDDDWLTVGSANLDGVSLHSYGHDFTGWLGRRVFRDVCNLDVNAVIHDRDGALGDPGRTLRTSLWREHLSLPIDAFDRVPDDGWLAIWRRHAAAGIALLNRPPMPNESSLPAISVVLPYSGCATPSEQLRDVGVRRVEGLDLRFDPGWLEIHLSPNWVRNMFA